MGLIRRCRTALARHHRSRGFGIHSPSAYRFVTEVLRERCHYYAYDDIRAWRKRLMANGVRTTMSNHEAQSLFRVVNHFAPRHVWQVGVDGILPIVTMLLCSSKLEVTVHDDPNKVATACDLLNEQFGWRVHLAEGISTMPDKPFVLVNALPMGEADLELLRDTLKRWLTESESVVILRNLHRAPAMKHLWHEAKAMMAYGHTFTNEKTAILVARPGIPRQDFFLWL